MQLVLLCVDVCSQRDSMRHYELSLLLTVAVVKNLLPLSGFEALAPASSGTRIVVMNIVLFLILWFALVRL